MIHISLWILQTDPCIQFFRHFSTWTFFTPKLTALSVWVQSWKLCTQYPAAYSLLWWLVIIRTGFLSAHGYLKACSHISCVCLYAFGLCVCMPVCLSEGLSTASMLHCPRLVCTYISLLHVFRAVTYHPCAPCVCMSMCEKRMFISL